MDRIRDVVQVSDLIQKDYAYSLVAPLGRNFPDQFDPHLTPKEMLKLGCFEGKYLNDCRGEFPEDWFFDARLSEVADPKVNYFGVKSRQSLATWQEKGWIIDPDPRGWFQWYCRYYVGRRILDVDTIQIKRWRAFRRHAGQIRANCQSGDIWCRPRQRQALLQWAYDPFI
jgi:hypothetical protein